MQIEFANKRDDFEALYDWMWTPYKKASVDEYYRSMICYTLVLVLAVIVSYRADQFFVMCVFLASGGFLWRQNFSFKRRWKQQVANAARKLVEYTATLHLDESGLTERFLELSLFVPWNQVKGYSEVDGRIFIPFLRGRSFVVPLRDLNSEAQTDFITILKRHGLRDDVPLW